MALQDSQIQDIFQSKVGRLPTPDETQKFKNASFDTLSSLDKVNFDTYKQPTQQSNPINTSLVNAQGQQVNPTTGQVFNPAQTNAEAYAKNTGDYNFANFQNSQATANQPTNLDNQTTAVTGTTGISPTQQAYTDVQKQVQDIDKAIAGALENKKKELMASGGIINDTQLRAMVAQEQAPLIAQRRDLANQQANLTRQLQAEQTQKRLDLQQQNQQNLQGYRQAQLGQKAQEFGVTTGLKEQTLAQQKALSEQRLASQKELATLKAQQNKDLAKYKQTLKGTTSSSGISTPYKSDLDAVIGNVKATIDSANGKKAFQEAISRARNDADKVSTIASVVLRNAPSNEKTDFANQRFAITQIDKAIKMLDENVKTGKIEATKQYLFNQAGKDYDPKLAQINQYLISAIQPYRNSITGAAWGSQEDAEYQQLFGSTEYSPTELKQRLQGIKEIMVGKSVNALSAYTNPLGTYEDIYSSKINTPSSPKEIRVYEPKEIPEGYYQASDGLLYKK